MNVKQFIFYTIKITFLLICVMLFQTNLAHANPNIFLGEKSERISIAVNGDFNGDGSTDYAVCTQGYSIPAATGCIPHTDRSDWTCNGTPNVGAVKIYTALTPTKYRAGAWIGGTTEDTASIILKGSPHDFAGISCATTDVNNDGIDDLIVGANESVYLVLGSTTLVSGDLANHIVYTGSTRGDGFGYAVAGAGDVNGDGYNDILMGAPHSSNANGDTGAVYLLLGSASPTSAHVSTLIKIDGETAFDLTGFAVAGAGDVNGDGYDDILIGGSKNNAGIGAETGAAYLVLGTPTIANSFLVNAIKYSGTQTYDRAGTSVAGVGDVNSDGYDDIVIGAPQLYNKTNPARGYAALVLGSARPTSDSLGNAVQYFGAAVDDGAGSAVSYTGDLNADGFKDFVIGAPYNDEGATDAGSSYVVLGDVTANLVSIVALAPSAQIRQYAGTTAYEESGYFLGPVAGDGFFIGAPNYSNPYHHAGGKIWMPSSTHLPKVTDGYLHNLP